jgi:nucleoside phosphorylase
MKICFIVAMQAEAQPFIDRFGVSEVPGFFLPLPCKMYQTDIDGNKLYVVLNGQQQGSDLVGCEAASVATMAAIQQLRPDLVINSGTCGAFKKNGASIGDVYISNGVMFHDRRVPGDDAWGTQSLGNYPIFDRAAEIANAIGFKMGKVTTGSSLDMQPCDLQIIEENHGELKDMEGAAVAFVCSLFKTPIMLIKSVTDLCDESAETFEIFKKNLAMASHAIADANEKVINYLLKKS